MNSLEISKYVLAAVLILAGTLHFIKPHFYKKIIPEYLPSPYLLVILSGVAEIICGLFLLFPKTQNMGAWLSIALFIAVFPANIEMTRKYYLRKKKGLWLTILRLPLQLFLIWWAYQFVN